MTLPQVIHWKLSEVDSLKNINSVMNIGSLNLVKWIYNSEWFDYLNIIYIPITNNCADYIK